LVSKELLGAAVPVVGGRELAPVLVDPPDERSAEIGDVH
jgi:hypothetical protein